MPSSTLVWMTSTSWISVASMKLRGGILVAVVVVVVALLVVVVVLVWSDGVFC
jgi:hypothetical protein